MDAVPSIEEFVTEARAWLDEHAERLPAGADVDDVDDVDDVVWGKGELSVAVFHALSADDERELLERAKAWTQEKAEHGYHAISWEPRYGGLGLPTEHARAFSALERTYVTPAGHETHSVTVRLIAPTVRAHGSDEQTREILPRLLSAKELCCQLFSEPGAGSDLAGLACRAERDGDEWVINGQKVWSSGAMFSEWGELIARSDPTVPKHRGLTAFLVRMDLPGIEVRPIRQMSGGASFNEVFFDDVRVPDSMRLGRVGDGWNVALTTLGFERDHADGAMSRRVGGSWPQLLATARATGATADPWMRQRLATAYVHHRVEELVNRRAADIRRAGADPGPEASLGKLMWTNRMTLFSDVVSEVLGAKLVADTCEWGTYAWSEHVLGAPGYRIAGGSDEVQRNIIGERVLGLPPEPRVDKDVPWREILR
jgi:alkylation response protein AidB-like acyl-CoA dehydrogenase